MRASEAPFFLAVLLVATSCSLGQSHESDGLDTPIPFPDRSDNDFPQQFDTNSDGRPDFYIKRRAVGNEDQSAFYLVLQSQGENSYLSSEDTGTESRYFNQGMEVGPFPDFLENPSAPITWYGLGFSVCELIDQTWQCGPLETEKKYLGLRLVRDGKVYYGWALVGANPKEEGSKILVHDLEISSEAGEPITTGEHP
jgi:hypothetical protein